MTSDEMFKMRMETLISTVITCKLALASIADDMNLDSIIDTLQHCVIDEIEDISSTFTAKEINA